MIKNCVNHVDKEISKCYTLKSLYISDVKGEITLKLDSFCQNFMAITDDAYSVVAIFYRKI